LVSSAAVSIYHQPNALNKKNCFLTFLVAEISKIKVLAITVSGEVSLSGL
jgi:hypothetical protein